MQSPNKRINPDAKQRRSSVAPLSAAGYLRVVTVLADDLIGDDLRRLMDKE